MTIAKRPQERRRPRSLSLSDQEFARFQGAAKRSGLPWPDYVRDLLERDAALNAQDLGKRGGK